MDQPKKKRPARVRSEFTLYNMCVCMCIINLLGIIIHNKLARNIIKGKLNAQICKVDWLLAV